MFVKKTEAGRIFKEAYKGVGLRIVNDGNGLALTGRAWAMYIFGENIPKEIMGGIISLTGAVPQEGEQVLYNKENSQTELYMANPDHAVYKRALEAQAAGNAARGSDVIITELLDRMYRVLTDSSGMTHPVPERIWEMISPANCEENEEMHGCFATKEGWIYWLSDHMAFGFYTKYVDGQIKARAEQLAAAGL